MADSMQNEAMQRLQQMYSKAQPQPHKSNINHPKVQESVDDTKKQADEKVVHKNKSDNLIDVLMRDKERSLILLLLVILMSEKADTSLLLALMYLII